MHVGVLYACTSTSDDMYVAHSFSGASYMGTWQHKTGIEGKKLKISHLESLFIVIGDYAGMSLDLLL